MNEHETEPIRGLPESLPAGERILWQGAPRWTSLALRAFHLRKVAIYFALLIAWRMGVAHADGFGPAGVLLAALPLTLLALAALAVLALMAWLSSRTTVYTITNRRVVLRIGIALSMTANIPFAIVQSAAVRLFRDGTGDIPLSLGGSGRIAYVPLWPHARPWRLARPEPMLRTVADAAEVAKILSRALSAAGSSSARGLEGARRGRDAAGNRAEARTPEGEAWPKAIA